MNDRQRDETDRLGEYLGGRLDAKKQEAYEEHLLADKDAANALYEELGIDDALQLKPKARARHLYWMAPVAAAAILLLMILPTGDPETPVFRGTSTSVEVVGPRGVVSGPFELRWRSVEGAAHYSVELFSAASNQVFSKTTSDTTLAVEGVATAGEGFWRVRARDEFSELIAESDPIPIDVRND